MKLDIFLLVVCDARSKTDFVFVELQDVQIEEIS